MENVGGDDIQRLLLNVTHAIIPWECAVQKWPFILSGEETSDFHLSWLSAGQCVLEPERMQNLALLGTQEKGGFSRQVWYSSLTATFPLTHQLEKQADFSPIRIE